MAHGRGRAIVLSWVPFRVKILVCVPASVRECSRMLRACVCACGQKERLPCVLENPGQNVIRRVGLRGVVP